MTQRQNPLGPDGLDRALVRLAAHRACGDGDLPLLSRAATRAIAAALGTERTAAWLFEEEGRFLRCTGNSTGQGATIESSAIQPLLDCLRKEPHFLERGDDGWPALLGTDPSSAADASLLLPIGIGAEAVGLLALGWSGAHELAERELLFVRAVTHLLATVHRHSDRSHTHRRLNEAEQRLASTLTMMQRVLDTIPVRVFWKDRDCRYLGCNLLFAKDAARNSPADMIGLSDHDMTWSDQAELYNADDRLVIETGNGRLNFEEPQTTPDGDQIWLRTSKIPLRGADDEVFGILGTYEDITERKVLEKKLQDQSEVLNSVLRDMRDAAVIVDRDANLLRQNREADHMWSREEIGGDPVAWSKRAGWRCGEEGGDITAADHPLARALAGEDVDRFEFFLQNEGLPDGKWMSASSRPLRDPEGRLQGAALIVRDITLSKRVEATLRAMNDELESRVKEKTRELEEAQAQLLQAQRIESIGQLAAGIAHEISTPIQYTTSNVQFLKDAFTEVLELVRGEGGFAGDDDEGKLAFLEEEIPVAIEQSQEGLELVLGIVQAMKSFSQGAGEGRKSIDLNEAIRNTTTIARNAWRSVATLELTLDPALGCVPCMPAELNQAILNVLMNATDAILAKDVGETSGPGTIRVSTLAAGDWVEIAIEDTGCGIPAEIRPKIFDPFFTTKPPGKGTGQGLSLVHSIVVKQHGGAIAIEKAAGGGTRFVVRLPAKDGVSLSATAASQDPAA